MENEFYTDEFEQFLKEKSDQFSMYPSRRVWYSIYNNLHPSRRWPSVVISLFFISSLILIGYLNAGENSITRQINTEGTFINAPDEQITVSQSMSGINKGGTSSKPKKQQGQQIYSNVFSDVITNETDFYDYTIVKSNRPVHLFNNVTSPDVKSIAETAETNNNNENVIQDVDAYIKSNQIFADVAILNKKNKVLSSKMDNHVGNSTSITDNPDELNVSSINNSKNIVSSQTANNNKAQEFTLQESKAVINANPDQENNTAKNEEKAWIENYAFENKSPAKKWKGRLSYQVYVTPAVNYRKLSTKVKGSATPFANGDINHSISQKPGFGFEAGLGLNYAAARRLHVKAGVQFNYTNYNISAGQANQPVATTILLNDPSTGFSYSAARTSTTSNTFNGTASRPVTLHNRTYQISLPIGFGYKLSSENNVEWFAGATVQPTYYFGGKAHLISSDLKSYVSEPSSINSFNLNLGFETYMNFKLGTYNLQVGPQVRYQLNSTYKKNLALIEKPYAIGLKFGLTKGF
ncbi:MAG: outer membrane beta-barrel protein [Ferruginibacter sp.]|nr:outer membrane beta-barrel protein [Ferruginibacter sp.]